MTQEYALESVQLTQRARMDAIIVTLTEVPPPPLVAPVISGPLVEGSTLTMTPATGYGALQARRWRRAPTGTTAWMTIADADALTYVTTAADVGMDVVGEEDRDRQTLQSNALGPIEALVVPVLPILTGPPLLGSTLTLTPATGYGTLQSRRWEEYDDGWSTMSGVSGLTFVPTYEIGGIRAVEVYGGVDRVSNSIGPIVAVLTVTPGAGFAGATTNPGQNGPGTGVGHASQPTCRWNHVPYDTLTETRYVGVIADHPGGLAYCRFELNGGAAVDVTREAVNPQTGRLEWFVAIPAAAMADAQSNELRVTCVPNDGPCRVLQGKTVVNEGAAGTRTELVEGEYSFWFATDANATLPTGVQYVDPLNGLDTNNGLTAGAPKKTHHAASKALSLSMSGSAGGGSASDNGGGTIYLLPYAPGHSIGTYAFPDPRQKYRWLTVTPAPGVSAEDCPVLGHTNYASNGSGLRARLIRYKNCRIKCPATLADAANDLKNAPFPAISFVSNPFGSGNSLQHTWVDGCTIDYGSLGNSWWEHAFGVVGSPIQYWTDCVVRNVKTPSSGHQSQRLIRNCTFQNVCEAASGSGCVAGCTFEDVQICGYIPIDTAPGDYPHSDIWQTYTLASTSKRPENRAFVECTCLGNDSQGPFINPDTGALRGKSFLIRDCEITRATGTPWREITIGPLLDGVLVKNVRVENAGVSPGATDVAFQHVRDHATDAQMWAALTLAPNTSDSVSWAAEGSPAFLWQASSNTKTFYLEEE